MFLPENYIPKNIRNREDNLLYFWFFFPNLFDFLRFDTSVHHFRDPFGPSMKVEYGIHYKSANLGGFCVHYYWPKILDFRIQPTLRLSGGLLEYGH
jgi:hypothetical protein